MLRSNLYGSLAVLAVVVAIALGLPMVDRSLPADRAVRPGMRLTIGRGVTVLPPDGAVVDVTKTFPSRGILVLAVGSVRIVLEASAYQGSLADLAARLRRKIRSNPGYQASQREHPTRTDTGAPGLQGSYSTSGRIGLYAVFISDGIGLEVSLAGSEVDMRRGTGPLLAAVRSIRFGGAA